jgi:hypothetical protein
MLDIIRETHEAVLDLDPWGGSNWIIGLRGDVGSARNLSFWANATLALDEIVTGSGTGVDFPRRENEPREFIVTGNRRGMKAQLMLRFWAQFLNGCPFECTGVISPNWKTITGRFKIGCFTQCGCGGGGGDFEATRLDD